MEIEQIEVLVLAAQEGDNQALDALYRHFFVSMRRYAALRVGSAAVAEDLVQNVWLQVSRRLRTLQHVRVFRSWLFRALRWEIVDWSRREPERNDNDLDEAEVRVATVNHELLDIAPLLATLGPSERDVVELFYLNELTVREVALALSVAEGTVKSRLYKARQQLRDNYQD